MIIVDLQLKNLTSDVSREFGVNINGSVFCQRNQKGVQTLSGRQACKAQFLLRPRCHGEVVLDVGWLEIACALAACSVLLLCCCATTASPSPDVAHWHIGPF